MVKVLVMLFENDDMLSSGVINEVFLSSMMKQTVNSCRWVKNYNM